MGTRVGLLIGGFGGILIAYIDSRPTWDDTGLTVAALVTFAGIASFAAGRRPWLWALLVGAPTPLFEIAQTGQAATVAALLFAAICAAIGCAASRIPAAEPRPSD